VTAVDFAEE